MASVWSEGSPSCHMTVGDKRKQYMQVDGPEREELLSLTMPFGEPGALRCGGRGAAVRNMGRLLVESAGGGAERLHVMSTGPPAALISPHQSSCTRLLANLSANPKGE